MTAPTIRTLGELRAAGFTPKSIKDELRDNLLAHLERGDRVFEGIVGYEDTVIPDLERAILAKHNINLLGLRGQAKTRIARQLTTLLDEWVAVVEGSELNDDPLRPLSRFAHDLIATHGDATPVSWLHRSERYGEKLATPDVTVADLIGDVDPIKAANMRLSYSDERVIHFGIVPRSHRCIFVINELPDLQARIQVALFNILQEGDIQIRGFKMRLPLDIQFVFTANPEDYTNRGSIVTPLKDRIGSQILTHYPKTIELSKQITAQEAKLTREQRSNILIGDVLATVIEQTAMQARESEYVDAKSGVSARLTISAYELLASAAERRAVVNREKQTFARITDLYAVLPAIQGKIELVYEGEQEGLSAVAMLLVNKAIQKQFGSIFPDPSKLRKRKERNPYQRIIDWFNNNTLDLLRDDATREYQAKLDAVEGLDQLINEYLPDLHGSERYVWKEVLLYGLAEYSQIGKAALERGIRLSDMLGAMWKGGNVADDDE